MSSKKGSKAVKAKRAEDEARRREELKEDLRERLDLESRALQVVERLLEDGVPEEFLIDCAKFITPANYKDVIEERFITKLCGYPVCENKLGKIPTQQFKISSKTNKVYDITERKCFCSNFCYKASKEFELKISTTPLWLRDYESPPRITLLKKGDGGSSGEEVRIAVRRLQEEDIEGPPPDAPHGARRTHSDDSDEGEQEQAFVSSAVDVKQAGPRVHWGETPARADGRGPKQRGVEEEEEKKEEQRRLGGGEHLVKERGADGGGGELVLGKGVGRGGTVKVEAAHAHLRRTPGEEEKEKEKKKVKKEKEKEEEEKEEGSVDVRSAEEAAALLASCRIAGQVKRSTAGHPGAGVDVTQVGMSKRGAAGLRELLLLHAPPAPSRSLLQEHRLQSLSRTLSQWHTQETGALLYGADRGPRPPGAQEGRDDGPGEEELDEDDLEEEEERGGGGGRARPSAAAPDYDTLQRQTQEQGLRVREFYQGSCIPPGDAERPAGRSEAAAQGRQPKDPILPLVDSQAQSLIQKRIAVDKLTRSLSDIVGPLGLTMISISTDLNRLVRTFSFTNTNIIHKAPGWTLIALVLLHLLTEVSPAVREALRSSESVQHVDRLLQEFGLERADLMTLLHVFRDRHSHSSWTIM